MANKEDTSAYEWQPIQTIPANGKALIVRQADGVMDIVVWDNEWCSEFGLSFAHMVEWKLLTIQDVPNKTITELAKELRDQ